MSDKLQALEALLPALPAATEQRKLGDGLIQATQALREAPQQARRLHAVLQVCGAVGYGRGADQAEVLNEVRRTALDVAEALEQAADPERLRTAVWDYEKTLLTALANLDRTARTQWRTMIAEQFQPLITFGDLLANMGEPELGAGMAACGRRAQEVGAAPAEQLADQIEALVTDLARLQSERSATIGSGDVGEFLNALAERRATLSMITPEVNTWLRDHDVLDHFSVSPL